MNIAQWRKDRLTTPSLSVLQRAVDLMGGDSAPHFALVHAAIHMAVREDVAANTTDYDSSVVGAPPHDEQGKMIYDVQNTYVRALRDFAFTTAKEGQSFAWWMAGKNASVIAKRRKVILKFMEAAVQKGQELVKADETFTYRAGIGSYTACIEKFKVESETKSTVTYLPNTPAGEVVSERKSADKHEHFATWEEAHSFLKAYSAKMLADARRILQIAQAYDGNVRGLKERSRKKTDPLTFTEVAKGVIEVTHADIAATQPDAEAVPA